MELIVVLEDTVAVEVRGRGVGTMGEGVFEEADAVVTVFVLSLELKMENQHAQETALFTGTHWLNLD